MVGFGENNSLLRRGIRRRIRNNKGFGFSPNKSSAMQGFWVFTEQEFSNGRCRGSARRLGRRVSAEKKGVNGTAKGVSSVMVSRRVLPGKKGFVGRRGGLAKEVRCFNGYSVQRVFCDEDSDEIFSGMGEMKDREQRIR
ncbi:hypothetical protein U1Q18_016789 [Sarracenia purpurea var. burkii]